MQIFKHIQVQNTFLYMQIKSIRCRPICNFELALALSHIAPQVHVDRLSEAVIGSLSPSLDVLINFHAVRNHTKSAGA